MEIIRNTKKTLNLTAFLSLILMVLSGCSSTKLLSSVSQKPNLPRFDDSLFNYSVSNYSDQKGVVNPKEKLIDIESLTKLDHHQEQAFLTFFNDPKFALTQPHTRVATYLGILLDQFTYSEKTYTAQQTLDNLSGNCLSLTMLSTALAELSGVNIHYQLLEENPVYSINQNLFVTSDHLRAVLSSPANQTKVGQFFRNSRIRIDYFNTDGLSFVDKISVAMQKSLYYSNIAVENLAINNVDLSYAYAKKALEIHPENASALNIVAILHRKRGATDVAEELYKFGAQYYSKAPLFIRNYKNLLSTQGRSFDLNEFEFYSDESTKSHPWNWVRAGKVSLKNGNFKEALVYFQRAIDIAPDVRQLHLYAGQASLALGKETQSKRHFINAYKLSKKSEDELPYKRKLLALKAKAYY